MAAYEEKSGFVADDEIVESVRTLQRQRSRKMVLMIIGLVLACIATVTSVIAAYSDAPEPPSHGRGP